MKNNMKATLSFNLDDEQDAQAHMRCVKALDMALAMWTFAGRLRDVVDTSEDGKYIDEEVVWKKWGETMEEYGIRFDELIK
jgi:hypothetical protein